MIIKSKLKNYELALCNDFSFINDIKSYSNTLTVVDKNVYELYYDSIFNIFSKEDLIIIDALEENKTIEKALEICEAMTSVPGKRNSCIIAFGGGIIQDIAGFAANILYRGIKWIFIPTTLLAACDSCIGGKTSLNYKDYKNLLGTFYPPDKIYVCPEFFKTLSDRDYKSGLGEVVKFNIMQGETGLSTIEKNIDKLILRDNSTVNRFVETSLRFKKEFIETDEFDKGERIKLNFAHTFGHAFETISNYEIPHGTAVAMGTLVANTVSLYRGILNKRFTERVEKLIIQIVSININNFEFNIKKFIDAIHKDKKQVDNNLKAILLNEDMELITVNDLKADEIEKAVTHIMTVLDKEFKQ